MKTASAALVAALLLLIPTVGCSSGNTPAAQDPIVVGVEQLPSLLSPLSVVADQESRTLVGLIYEGLYSISPRNDSNPVGFQLATGLPSPVGEDLKSFWVQTLAGAHWHDGTAFSAADVVHSWAVVSDPRNEYSEQSVLVGLISSISVERPNVVRINTRRQIIPVDVARLLSFPIVPAHVGNRPSPQLVHPESAKFSPALAALLEHPVGTGVYSLVGNLERDGRFIFVKRLDSARALVWRAIPRSDGRLSMTDAKDHDIILASDSALEQRLGSSFIARRSGDSLSIGLVLNPYSGLFGSADRRVHVMQMLAGTSPVDSCPLSARLPYRQFRVLIPSRVAVMSDAVLRLRRSVACLHSTLVVVTRGRLASAFQNRLVEAAFVQGGDQISEVTPVLDAVRGTSLVSPTLFTLDQSRRTAAHFSTRDSLGTVLLKVVERDGIMIRWAVTAEKILIRSSLGGFSFSQPNRYEVTRGRR